MLGLPERLGGGALLAWRLDRAEFALGWDSGEGAYRFGGRWSSRGTRAVYCALDPACAILEVAAHLGFRQLHLIPHVLTALRIDVPDAVHIVPAEAVPDPGWLRPGEFGAGSQRYGDAMLARHRFLAVPSVVSTHSWNLVFRADDRPGYTLALQEPFALDPRLTPPARS